MTTGIHLPWRAVVWALACTLLLPLTSGTVIGTERGALAPAAAMANRGDPLASARWGEMQRQFIGNAPFVFDPQVKVSAPELAENPLQVPISVDASALAGVEEVIVFADFNPIVEILRFYPEAVPASLGFRIKLQQSTPVRAAARTRDGVWHVGGSWVNTAGGGCTTPSLGSGSPLWQAQLNQVAARQWSTGPNAGRLRLKIVHPMDTGLVAGIPAFFLEEITLRDAAGQRLLRVQPAEPVAENPVFTLGGLGHGAVEASGRDNNGNQFSTRIAP
ncbi:quinoprotein dehydrogenase-associated SoxYZ-like carrier [Dechloromonas sp. ZY10]|uniref:quinoprotein dehydrogenase-associated SoxYZ-like carrier n=1 Tax=Dechloromonas aquae TaxID=2664436 RepID=UPI003528B387